MKQEEANKKIILRKLLLWITIVIAVCIVLVALYLSYYLAFIYPENQVSQLGITNVTEKANFINQYRTTSIQLITTFAQIFGGIAVAISIYFAWGNLVTAREGQVTERFTRAVNQLGSDKIEIRLGGIYALERIANESEKDYWPIMEILTAYIREKSSIENKHQSYLNEDIQAILSVIRIRKHFLNNGENKGLDLHKTYLKEANLEGANLEGANLEGAYLRQAQLKGADLRQARLKEAELIEVHLEETHLEGVYLEETYLGVPDMNPRVIHLERAHLEEAHLRGVNLFFANLEGAHLESAHLEGTNFIVAHLERSHLKGANLKGADLQGSCLEGADLEGADLEGAELENVDLRGAVNLTIEQLLKVKTLYKTKLDEKLLERLKTKTEYHKLSENPHLEKA